MKRTTMALWAITLAVLVGTTARANDEQIATQIIQRLQQQQQVSQMEGFNIGVQVEQGTVTVMGTVSQSEHALLALDVARRVPGVKLVVNDLYVQPSGAVAQPTSPQAPISTAAANLPLATKSEAVSAPTNAPIAGLETLQASRPTTMPEPVAAAALPTGPAATLPLGSGALGAATLAAPAAGLAVNHPQPMPQPSQVAQPLVQPQPSVMPAPAAAAPRSAQSSRRKPVAFAPATSTSVQAQQASFNVAPEYQQAAPAQYSYSQGGAGPMPVAMGTVGGGAGVGQASYDNPQMPGYAWPSYAAYPNYAALTYPHQYSATAWPYIGPFYPYPQVPLGWRKVTLEWDDGWWFLDFKSKTKH